MEAQVVAVCSSSTHTMRKPVRESIQLITGQGVKDDAHAGATIKHRSRVAKDASQPNLRQVHLIHSELHDEVGALGLQVGPGEMGENITTAGVDLLGLPTGTRLMLGSSAVIEITGLRNPCSQLEDIQPGLLRAVLARDADGNVVRKAGVMAIVVTGGEVKQGDPIRITLPSEPRLALERV
jgi:MOSC domain-containing protein YiiM